MVVEPLILVALRTSLRRAECYAASFLGSTCALLRNSFQVFGAKCLMINAVTATPTPRAAPLRIWTPAVLDALRAVLPARLSMDDDDVSMIDFILVLHVINQDTQQDHLGNDCCHDRDTTTQQHHDSSSQFHEDQIACDDGPLVLAHQTLPRFRHTLNGHPDCDGGDHAHQDTTKYDSPNTEAEQYCQCTECREQISLHCIRIHDYPPSTSGNYLTHPGHTRKKNNVFWIQSDRIYILVLLVS